MRFGRARVPVELAGRSGRLLAWTRLADGRVWGMFRDRFVLALAGATVESFEYCEVRAASWRNEDRTLAVSFVDAHTAEARLVLAEGEGDDAVAVFRELVDASFFWKASRRLPSGARADATVRRRGDGSLFTQILAERTSGGPDCAELARIEAQMRDLAGLS